MSFFIAYKQHSMNLRFILKINFFLSIKVTTFMRTCITKSIFNKSLSIDRTRVISSAIFCHKGDFFVSSFFSTLSHWLFFVFMMKISPTSLSFKNFSAHSHSTSYSPQKDFCQKNFTQILFYFCFTGENLSAWGNIKSSQ